VNHLDMDVSSLRQAAAAIGLAVAGLAAAPAAQALVIDDWNTSIPFGVLDIAADSTAVVAARTSVGGTSLTRGNMMADLASGDAVRTQDCANCQQGHFVNDANSQGSGYWQWTASPFSIGPADSVAIDYGTDVTGGDMLVAFLSGGILRGYAQWKDLPDTNLVMTGSSRPIVWVGSSSAIDEIYLHAFSIGGMYTVHGQNFDLGATATSLDLNVDNLRVPEPGSLALVSLALAGLGLRRRDRR